MTQIDNEKSAVVLAAELEDAHLQVAELKRSVDSARSETLRLERILEGSHIGTWEWNVQTGETVFNEVWAQILGYSLDELAPTSIKTWEAFAHPEELRRSSELLERHFNGELADYAIDCRMKHKDGHWVWVRDRGRVISRTNDGRPLMMVGTHMDITERKQAEAALRTSEAKHASMLASLSEVIGIMGVDGVLKYKSPNIEKWFGWKPEDLVGTDGWLTVHPDDRDRIQKEFGRLLTGESPRTVEYRYTCKDGSYKPIELTAVDLTKDPIIGGVLMNYHDITERKQAEVALARSHELLTNLARLVPSVIYQYRLDPDGHSAFPYASPGMNDIYEVTPEEVREDATVVFGRLHPEDYEQVANAIQESARTLATFHSEFRVVLPRQGLRWRWSQAHRERTSDGGTLWHGIISDITERKRGEEEKAKLELQLRQAQKMDSVGRLAGGVAHDFNNMLGVILGRAEMVLEQIDPSDPLHEDLREIKAAAERSASLTRQLLAFARKQTVAPKVLDLNGIVDGMLKMLRRLLGEDIALTWLPAPGLWPVKVDPSQIDQILANLCVNARDAIRGVGRLSIETGNTTFDADYCAFHAEVHPGAYVKVVVSDTGCGMDRATQDKLFEPFFTTKEAGKGTGLGLATVYGIVKQNEGFINVYSEPGHGTTFSVYLPRHLGQDDQVQTKGSTVPAPRGHETILLVEDEPAVLKMTKRMLERQGYNVVAASTPGEAIRVARDFSGEIHLLMTDIVMPEMNGWDLARILIAFHSNLKHLFMSGYTSDVIARHGVLGEGVHFIQKPFSPQAIAAKVREALSG